MKYGRLVCPAQEQLGILALYVHDLTGTADARRLLSKPPLIHPATPDILPRLRQWNPEIASKLSGKDSAVKTIPFKLVTTNRSWVSDETDSFVAVSYCWHSKEWNIPSRFSLTPEKWSFPISPAMVRAMFCHIKNRKAIWLDQLCIEQDDMAQKAHAIANMDTIYRNAQEVVILLEDLDMSSEVERLLALWATMPTTEAHFIHDQLYLSPETVEAYFHAHETHTALEKSLVRFMCSLFDCRWFERAWCSQEYLLNPIRTFLAVGHTWQCVAFSSDFFGSFHENLAEANIDLENLDLLPKFQRFSFGIGLNYPEDIEKFDVLLLFVELERMSCHFRKDLVSIALNTSGIFLSFDSDVHSKTECHLILSLILLAAGDLRVLDTIGPAIRRLTTPNYPAVIRWPKNDDFRFWKPERAIIRKQDSQLKFSHINLDVLTLDLFLLGNQPALPTKESMNQATAYWAAYERLGHQFEGRDEPLQFKTASLACALGIGLPRMVQTINDVNANSKYPETWRRLPDDALRSFAKEVATFRVSADGEKQSVEVDKTIPEIVMPFLDKVDDRFRHISRTIPLEIQLKKNSNHNAILFVPSKLKQIVENAAFTYHIAVPAALNTRDEAYMRRVWILEDGKTTQPTLAIVAQGYLLSGDITMDMDVSYMENVSVVGRWNSGSDEYDSAEEWADFPGEE